MRIRAAISPWHLLLVGALALAWLAIACGGDEGTQPEDAPTPSTAGGSVADDAGEQHTPGLCIPAAPLAASVGDMWTLSGTTRTTGRPTEDTFQSPIEVTTSYTVKAFEDGLWYVRGQTYLVGRSKVRVQSTSSVRDGEGTAQAPQVEELERSTIQAANMGPLLTLDWECHRESWLEAWSEDASTAETQPEPTVEERTLSSGLTVVVFSVKQVLDQPEEGIEGTVERSLGYDKATGRLVLIETLGSGTRNGEPFSSETMQELVADSAPRETSPPASDAPTDVSVPAPIESVEIEYMAGSPPDTSLVVVSGLPNTCAKFEGHRLTHEGDTIRVSVTNSEPVGDDLVCAQVFDTVVTRIPLGGEIEACKVYEVVVNGESRSIQAIGPNIRCAPPPELGVEIQVSLNKTVRLESEGLRVGLLDVSEDSRCPSDVTCIQAGQAAVAVDVAHDVSRTLGAPTLALGTGNEEDAIASFAGYSIRLIRLDPYPVSTAQTRPEEYVATLIVTKE